MSTTNRMWLMGLVLAGALASGAPAVAEDDEAFGFERTPPRLSLLDGQVSFFRPGAADWAAAALNTPLAPGDELYAGSAANLELQIGALSFVRAGEHTELALLALEPDYVQFRVSAGTVSLDLRRVEAGQAFEVATPNAAFTIERNGYYRVEVFEDATALITRRGGRASVTPVNGASVAVAGSEQVVISGSDAPRIETYAAPEPDAWDRWNQARTDRQLDAVSARYVPAGVYGVHDLDHHGSWRVVPSYGAIWVPSGVAVGWAPYTTGRWVYDPFYGWTWIDAAPWGWAPYHYGRWVRVSGRWAWAPGPIIARPVYAPALVAFYGGGVSVGVSVAGPIGWVALGWGEPLFPWWGPTPFRHRAHWHGWGGPRVVNRVVIRHRNPIHVRDVHTHEHMRERHAFVAMDRDSFGRRPVRTGRIEAVRREQFRPLADGLEVRPRRESLVPSDVAGRRPPREWRERSVVATRAPRPAPLPDLENAPRSGPDRARGKPVRGAVDGPAAEPRVRVVEPPRARPRPDALERPPFGTRGNRERAAPPPLPRYPRGSTTGSSSEQRPERERTRAVPQSPPRPELRRGAPAPREEKSGSSPEPVRREPRTRPDASAAPDRGEPPRANPDARTRKGGPRAPRRESATPPTKPREPRALPGEPANRVFRGRGKYAPQEGETRRENRGKRGGDRRGAAGRD